MTSVTDIALEPRAEEAASLLKAMGHPARLLVLCLLSGGERSVGELGSRVALSQSALSQHLAVLRGQGLVAARREGTSVRYRIEDPAASRVVGALAAIYCPDMVRDIVQETAS